MNDRITNVSFVMAADVAVAAVGPIHPGDFVTRLRFSEQSPSYIAASPLSQLLRVYVFRATPSTDPASLLTQMQAGVLAAFHQYMYDTRIAATYNPVNEDVDFFISSGGSVDFDLCIRAGDSPLYIGVHRTTNAGRTATGSFQLTPHGA